MNRLWNCLKLKGLWCLAIDLILLAAIFIAVGIYLLQLGHPSDTPTEVGKWLLTLATALVTAGAVSGLVRLVGDARSEHERQTDLRREEREKWNDRLQALVAAGDTVLVARLLLSTYDVKTYFEQFPELARARADLRRLEVAIKQDTELHEAIRKMVGYLDRFGGEYQKHYRKLARQQRLDEAHLTKRIDEAVTNGKTQLPEEELLRKDPAERMLHEKDFRRLAQLCDRYKFRSSTFKTGYDQARQRLEDKASAPTPTERGHPRLRLKVDEAGERGAVGTRRTR